MDIALLTPIEVEYAGFRSRLQQIDEKVITGKVYETGKFIGLSIIAYQQASIEENRIVAGLLGTLEMYG